VFARLSRGSCTACGARPLVWGSVGDELVRLVDAGQDGDAWLRRVGQGLGVNGSALMRLEAWRCDACGEVGVFGPLEVGP
jgi:hypothetical protein